MFSRVLPWLFLSLCTATGLMAEAVDEVPMPPPDQGMWQTLVLIGIAFVFFYIILWRPEQKRRKELEQSRDQMKKGDTVTAMGIIGTVSKIKEHTVILKMVDGSKIEFIKAAISEVQPQGEAAVEASDEDK